MTPFPAGMHALITDAYAEDLGDIGDVTTASVISHDHMARAEVVAREAGTIAGIDIVAACFHHVDPLLETLSVRSDGDRVDAGTTVAVVTGRTASILSAERVALNFLGHLSGIATATRAYVDAVAGTGASISDTRKTTPCLRAAEKYAVTMGGGINHRFGLYDAVLIKDNHVAAAGSIAQAVRAAREHVGDAPVEVEVDTLAQLSDVLTTDADKVLLDNMGIELLIQAVDMVDGRLTTEASGGINLGNVRAVAETGVDVISVGWITHSAPSLDVALDLVVEPTMGNGQFE